MLCNQEHATLIIVPKIANGLPLDYGPSALNLVAEVCRTEPVLFNRLHAMAEWTVLENQPNLGTAIRRLVLLTANGASGANGISAQNHAEEECMADVEILKLRNETEEKFVLEDQLKWNRATCSLAKFVRTALVMAHCVQHGSTIAARVHSSTNAARKLVDCANWIDALKQPTDIPLRNLAILGTTRNFGQIPSNMYSNSD